MMLALLSVAIIAYGQGEKKSDSPKKAAAPTADIAVKTFNQAKELMAANSWAAAEEKLNFMITKYPNSKYYEPSFYWLAYARKRQGKYQEALLLINKFIIGFPQSTWKDDARSMRAELAAKVGNAEIINEELQNADNDEIKLAALTSLLQVDMEKGLSRASKILNSKSDAGSRNLREGVINLIGKYGGSEAADILLNVARNETDQVVRTAAVFGLRRHYSESALTQLAEFVTKCDDEVVVEAGLFVISQHENQGAKVLLVEIASTAQSPQTRKQAVHFLGKFKGVVAIGELIELYDAVGEDIEVKRSILFTLSQTGDPSAQSRVFEISRLTDNTGLREEGILSLGQYGDGQIISRMIGLYNAETREEVKGLILLSLSKSGQKNALEKLKYAAQNEKSPELRKKAAQVLKQRMANSRAGKK